jgi:hypothetical protein
VPGPGPFPRGNGENAAMESMSPGMDRLVGAGPRSRIHSALRIMPGRSEPGQLAWKL